MDFDLGKIDEMLQGRVRLGIMVYVAQAGVAEFVELKAALKATQGNLSVHLSKLAEAGYIEIDKSFLHRKPLTRVRLTRPGRKALSEHLAAIAKLIDRLE